MAPSYSSYILMICTLYKACKTLQLVHYADDATVFFPGKDMQDIKSIVYFDSVSIAMWLQTNRLTLNVSKSYFMLHSFL